MNIGSNTNIIGNVKPGTLAQALADKNLHRNFKHDYFGARVQRGTVEVYLSGEWRTVRFDCADGWCREVEVL